ncbi:MAG: CheW domain protein [Gemmatimonadetes bacterium]|nr:CheW domain protein [Gemmatimonadota bacterium]
MSDSEQFVDQFIDDYFSECDEHLATVRRVLLALEDDPSGAATQGGMLELQRALHTIKGLSGMVGLAAAEQVAHTMEDGVRAIGKHPTVVRPALLELLFAGENLLEQAIASRRRHGAPPPTDAYVARMRGAIGHGAGFVGAPVQHVPGMGLALSSDASVVSVEAGARQRFDFTPSAAASARGTGVETVRRWLLSLGEIVEATPRVRAEGGVTFEFVVAMRRGAQPIEEWRADGLEWADFEVMPREAPADMPDAARAATPAANLVRVDLARLDDVMRMVGEMVLTRSRLDAVIERMASRHLGEQEDLEEANEALERQLRNLREGVMRIRLVPIGEVFERMRFAVREMARESGAVIRLDFEGGATEIDKVVVDRMLEPLMHLVRNSVSHGIESRTQRLAAGKPAEGRVSLRARAAGDRIMLEIEDDGAGLDAARVASRARELGLMPRNGRLDDETMLDLVCTPGFSTRDQADMGSGRGVGMSVVRSAVRALGGELFLQSRAGLGACFTIELPLTLMIADAIIVQVGEQVMAIPQLSLREIVPMEELVLTRMENNEMVSYRGGVLPLVRLASLFGFPTTVAANRGHVLVVGSDSQMAGLVVDRLQGLREIVMHPISDPLVTVTGVSGATELADGRVSLILDAAALVRRTTREAHGSTR